MEYILKLASMISSHQELANSNASNLRWFELGKKYDHIAGGDGDDTVVAVPTTANDKYSTLVKVMAENKFQQFYPWWLIQKVASLESLSSSQSRLR
jgi:hypothetical protein